jgi:hypothetical protein
VTERPSRSTICRATNPSDVPVWLMTITPSAKWLTSGQLKQGDPEELTDRDAAVVEARPHAADPVKHPDRYQPDDGEVSDSSGNRSVLEPESCDDPSTQPPHRSMVGRRRSAHQLPIVVAAGVGQEVMADY